VAGVALDSSEIVNGGISDGVDDRADRRHEIPEPPLLLRHPPGVSPPLPPLRAEPVVADLRRTWERLTAPAAAAAAGGRLGVGGRLRHQAKRVIGRLQRSDRALLGDLVRALEAAATRTDELADRLARLEALVEELVQVFSEDVTQMRAALAARTPQDAPSGGGAAPGDT
jgi:hypothetical protein